MKKSNILAVAAVAVVAILIVCAVYALPSSEGEESLDVPTDNSYFPSKNYEYLSESVNSSDWNYWFGNLDLLGVSDSKTPTKSEDLVELWKVADKIDGGSMIWKVPGSGHLCW